MSMQARIRELDTRHANLETKINNELKRPAYDTIHLSTLKKKKLLLKQQLTALKQQH